MKCVHDIRRAHRKRKRGARHPYPFSIEHARDIRRSLPPLKGYVSYIPRIYGRNSRDAVYELLRLLPTNRGPTMPDSTRIPPWLSQRAYGEPLSA
eukprot:6010992-Pyramimonas_sp.AAC.1